MIEIREETPDALDAYAAISMAFEVREVLDCVVEDGGLDGFRLVPRPLAAPYIKDYDVDAGGGPARLRHHFDLSRWGMLGAFAGGERVGAAVVAHDTPGVELLQGRRDLVVLWDLRVAPARRGRGIGSALFAAVERWGEARRCRTLMVETQNVNVPACRFYRHRGCELGAVHRFAYPALPHEVQLLWFKGLNPVPSLPRR